MGNPRMVVQSSAAFAKDPRKLLAAVVVGTALAIGLMIYSMPILAIALPTLLVIPIACGSGSLRMIQWILVAVVLSRILLLVGAPSTVAYVHFGIVVMAMPVYLFSRHRLSGSQRSLENLAILGIAVLTASVAVSALANQWLAARPLILWLTLIEPFFVIMLGMLLSPDDRASLRRTVVALGVIQVPFAIVQFIQLGYGDPVRGTLIEHGSGAHSVAAIAMMAGLVMLISPDVLNSRAIRFVTFAFLLGVGVISDAKQVFGAAVLAAIPFFLASLGSKRILRLAAAGACLLVSFAIVESQFQMFEHLTDKQRLQNYYDSKFSAWEYSVNKMGNAQLMVGLGPGLGASRVSYLNIEGGYGNVPESIAGTGQSELAMELREFGVLLESSAAAATSSFLGIMTDIGVFGLAGFALLSLWVWQYSAFLEEPGRSLSRFLLVWAAILGLTSAWLEEPVFMVFLAATLSSFPILPGRRGLNQT